MKTMTPTFHGAYLAMLDGVTATLEDKAQYEHAVEYRSKIADMFNDDPATVQVQMTALAMLLGELTYHFGSLADVDANTEETMKKFYTEYCAGVVAALAKLGASTAMAMHQTAQQRAAQ